MQRVDSRPAQARWRTWAALLLVYVAGLLAQGLHFALERHEVCEHGELEHAQAPIESGAADTFDGPAVSSNDAATDAEHHHCAVATATQFPTLEWPQPFLPHFAAPSTIAPIRPGAPRVPRTALYRIAPHHSPPVS